MQAVARALGWPAYIIIKPERPVKVDDIARRLSSYQLSHSFYYYIYIIYKGTVKKIKKIFGTSPHQLCMHTSCLIYYTTHTP